jgi:hypothetical protein
LENYDLFEPAWKMPPFEDIGKECFIFFPESLSDFDEYRNLLLVSGHVKTIQAGEAGQKPCDVFYYTNARSEITEAVLYIMSLHETQSIPWDSISVSIPDTESYGPYLFREFDNRNIPYIRQSGKPLASYPAGQFFSALSGCVSDNFSFASLTALLSNQHLPWKDEEKIQSLIKFGIDNNCICSWAEEDKGKEIKINVWEDAFIHSNDFAYLYNFFKRIMRMINALRYADSFVAIRKHYFVFRESFFDMEKCLSETDLVLSRCITELSYLCEIENAYPDVCVPDPYLFFTGYLEEASYLSQQLFSGVAILPYRTAAPAPFDCHIILGASHDSLSAVFSPLSFLPGSKRKKLGIIENDASQAFINLHRFNSRLPAAFFCSELTFSGYTIPHSALGAAIKPKQRYGDDPQHGIKFAADLYRLESECYSSLLFPVTKIHKNQKLGFYGWLSRRSGPAGHPACGYGNEFLKHIRERFLYKGDNKELAGKYGVSSSSLSSYFKCPLLFIFERVLKLQNINIDTGLMANEISGIVYHRILNLFFDELKGEVIAMPLLEDTLAASGADCRRGVHTQELATRGSFRTLKKGMYSETNTLPKQHTPSLQGGVVDEKSKPILPKSYSNILAEKVNMVFDAFPYLSENENKPAMSMLTVRLLQAQKELFSSQLENFLISFISYFEGYIVIASEERYTLDREFYYLNGSIDCILEDIREASASIVPGNNSLVIVDFKTKKMPKLADCTGENGLADFQLPMYIRLAERKFGKKAGAALFFSILDAQPQVLFGSIQNVLNGNYIPKKEEKRIMHGSSIYEQIMNEFDEKSEQFAKDISTGTFSFFPSHWELCVNCEHRRVCRTLYKVYQRKNDGV